MLYLRGAGIALILLVLPAAVLAERPPIFQLSPKMSGIPLGLHMEFIEDRGRKLRARDVVVGKHDGLFFRTHKRLPGFGFTPAAYWIRWRVRNPRTVPATFAVEFANPSVDRVEFYLPSRAAPRRIITGDHVPFGARETAYRNVVQRMRIPAGQTRVYHARVTTSGVMNLHLKAWTPAEHTSAILREYVIHALYLGLLLALIVYNGFVSLSVRGVGYIYYVLFILGIALVHLSLSGLGFQVLWGGIPAFSDYSVPFSLYATGAAAALFAERFLGTAVAGLFERLLKGLAVIGGVVGIVHLGGMAAGLRVSMLVANLYVGVGALLLLSTGIVALVRGSRPARFYVISWAALLLAAIATVLTNAGITPRLARLGVVEYGVQVGSGTMVVLLSLGLADVINRMRGELQEYNLKLESLVDERTKKLDRTLQEVRGLKTQQDGDYFLTSLLTRPLSRDASDSAHIDIDVHIDQYKKFQFRQWNSELGGDFCISDSVSLRDQRYAVFLNGDAMGKSMQGAGGYLIAAAVFRSILERTKNVQEMQDIPPERWLKNAFIELNGTFEAFDGSMLVSTAMGLIDEKTGVLYSINAEHPPIALYREGRAEFIESERIFAKLGSALQHGDLMVSTFQLRPGDSVFVGSDGRDDVRLPTGNGSQVINDDERRFLRALEQAEGQMEALLERLFDGGEATDDVSIMKISVLSTADSTGPNTADEDAQASHVRELMATGSGNGITELEELLREEPGNIPALKALTKQYVSVKNYAAAGEAASRIVERRPSESEYMRVAAVCIRRAGDAIRAIDLGERYRLRNPEHAGNLLNLAAAYQASGKTELARKFAERAQKLKRVRDS